MNTNEKKKFSEIYNEYYLLHPDGESVPKTKFYYLHRQWFFPGHIDLVLENIVSFHKKYYPKSNLAVALFAGLMHDAGLVYQRTEASAEGHENRSSVYAQEKLQKAGFDKDFINKVIEAIEATDSKVAPTSEESLLVRNADAYSHITSLHFFAKAYFSDELDYFIDWFSKKIDSTFNKLTIPHLIEEVRPLIERYKKMLEIYEKYKDKKFDIGTTEE